MEIGVLTGGGDAPGLNAVIRAIVKTATFKYGFEVIGIIDSFDGLLTPTRTRTLTPWNTRGILFLGGTILGTSSKGDPFDYRTEGEKAGHDLSSIVVDNIRDIGIDVLVVIGGDGSLKIAHRFQQLGINIVGVPKTIDNDLMATDVTFGFQTAVDTATEALDKLHTTAESHHRVIVLELMGRYAGWIALEAGIAGSADAILIPEIPFDIEKVCEKILERKRLCCSSSIVVVAEGARPVGGEMSVLERASDGSKKDIHPCNPTPVAFPWESLSADDCSNPALCNVLKHVYAIAEFLCLCICLIAAFPKAAKLFAEIMIPYALFFKHDLKSVFSKVFYLACGESSHINNRCDLIGIEYLYKVLL